MRAISQQALARSRGAIARLWLPACSARPAASRATRRRVDEARETRHFRVRHERPLVSVTMRQSGSQPGGSATAWTTWTPCVWLLTRTFAGLSAEDFDELGAARLPKNSLGVYRSATTAARMGNQAVALVLGCPPMLNAAGEPEFTILDTPPGGSLPSSACRRTGPQARWRSDCQRASRSGHQGRRHRCG